ncbi:MAG: hypothetical protein MUQ30_01010 [Anaerolineae bacterium]|nr:hypothetical protein [Anaerolineae bacterium]
MKALENCQWTPRWVSHLGCIKGCLDFLGIEISDAWLYGGTGHAFVINLHEGVCSSGPTAWKTVKLFELGKNLGYRIEGVFGHKGQNDFAQLQHRAWEHVRLAIDQGRPCYGWELEIPEFYVVYGYDEAGADTAGADAGGYYYSGPGCDEGKGPKPWQELADTGIGALELCSVWPGEAADDATTVKQALTFALEHAANSEAWIFEHYRAGLEGYDNWIRALRQGNASDMGMRYNTAVWLECRKNAAGFLAEAKERLVGQADAPFDEALAHYTVVSERLGEVAQIYPWSFEASAEDLLSLDVKSQAAVEALIMAREAEAAGLEALGMIIQAL